MVTGNDTAVLGRRRARWSVLAGGLVTVLLGAGCAAAQALRVLPVNIQVPAGQRATTLTVVNEGSTETAVQIRTYAWDQHDGDDKLTPTEEVVTSPPLATIAPGASQVVRLVLRRAPDGREATFRILLDQIPAPSQPGKVQIVLRLSIPIFAQPPTRTTAHMQFFVEREADKAYLVAINDGLRHEAVRDIVLATSDGRKLKTESSATPYVLAGATRRWLIVGQGALPELNETVQLTAHVDAGALNQQVHVVKPQ